MTRPSVRMASRKRAHWCSWYVRLYPHNDLPRRIYITSIDRNCPQPPSRQAPIAPTQLLVLSAHYQLCPLLHKLYRPIISPFPPPYIQPPLPPLSQYLRHRNPLPPTAWVNPPMPDPPNRTSTASRTWASHKIKPYALCALPPTTSIKPSSSCLTCDPPPSSGRVLPGRGKELTRLILILGPK